MNYKVGRLKLMFWASYFSLVLALHLFHTINALSFWNLLLVFFAFFPISERVRRQKLWYYIRNYISLIFAVTLLWHESYLPPINVLWNFFTVSSMQPSPTFVWNFFISMFSLNFFLLIFGILLFSYLISYTPIRKYFSLFFIIFFFAVGFTEKKVVSADWLENFYSEEKTKQVEFVNNPANDYDIIILQLCSFSWDDFDYVNYDIKPFFKKFDFVFTNFNSATAYSNQAVLRLLRSSCGQTSQATLFTDVDPKCYLMDNLRNIGYKTYTDINHDGAYSGFQDAVYKYGHADLPLNKSILIPQEKSFDGTSVYSDYETLDIWSQARNENNQKSALFYNSISLHTGSQYLDNEYLPEIEQYDLALSKVVSDLDRFLLDIKNSGRKTIVIVLGEHGSALRGSSIQLATVREIPLPSITHVPVVIKIFGPEFNSITDKTPTYISEQTSHFALAELLSRIIAAAPTDYNNLNKDKLVSNLPKTDLVSENETGVILQNKSGLYYRLSNQKTWNRLLDSYQASSSSYLLK